jgi:hypothetical protein
MLLCLWNVFELDANPVVDTLRCLFNPFQKSPFVFEFAFECVTNTGHANLRTHFLHSSGRRKTQNGKHVGTKKDAKHMLLPTAGMEKSWNLTYT